MNVSNIFGSIPKLEHMLLLEYQIGRKSSGTSFRSNLEMTWVLSKPSARATFAISPKISITPSITPEQGERKTARIFKMLSGPFFFSKTNVYKWWKSEGVTSLTITKISHNLQYFDRSSLNLKTKNILTWKRHVCIYIENLSCHYYSVKVTK